MINITGHKHAFIINVTGKNKADGYYNGRMEGRCHLVLQSAGSNSTSGIDVCSRS